MSGFLQVVLSHYATFTDKFLIVSFFPVSLIQILFGTKYCHKSAICKSYFQHLLVFILQKLYLISSSNL